MRFIYFDHNATTPLDAGVLEAMLPFMREQYGNASSRHDLGITARRAIDAAREQVAALVNVRPPQVVFTSGGTEANNLFIKGAADNSDVGLIAEDGQEGGALLYRTTPLFLDKLGLQSLDTLPPIAPLLPETDELDGLSI